MRLRASSLHSSSIPEYHTCLVLPVVSTMYFIMDITSLIWRCWPRWLIITVSISTFLLSTTIFKTTFSSWPDVKWRCWFELGGLWRCTEWHCVANGLSYFRNSSTIWGRLKWSARWNGDQSCNPSLSCSPLPAVSLFFCFGMMSVDPLIGSSYSKGLMP